MEFFPPLLQDGPTAFLKRKEIRGPLWSPSEWKLRPHANRAYMGSGHPSPCLPDHTPEILPDHAKGSFKNMVVYHWHDDCRSFCGLY